MRISALAANTCNAGRPILQTRDVRNMRYDSIIFDLDGTLWDTSQVTANGWNNALIKNGLREYKISSADVRNVSGMPLQKCISILFKHIPGIDLVVLEKLICAEEEKAFEVDCGRLYPDVKKGIKNISQKYPLFLVSNCQSWYLNKFWDQFNLEKYFTGQDCHGNANKTKSEMIKRILQKYNLKNAIYIGDTKGDKAAAMEAGVEFGYANYGFGDLEKEEKTIKSFRDLTQCLA